MPLPSCVIQHRRTGSREARPRAGSGAASQAGLVRRAPGRRRCGLVRAVSWAARRVARLRGASRPGSAHRPTQAAHVHRRRQCVSAPLRCSSGRGVHLGIGGLAQLGPRQRCAWRRPAPFSGRRGPQLSISAGSSRLQALRLVVRRDQAPRGGAQLAEPPRHGPRASDPTGRGRPSTRSR
jgi:hypothetical protein